MQRALSRHVTLKKILGYFENFLLLLAWVLLEERLMRAIFRRVVCDDARCMLDMC